MTLKKNLTYNNDYILINENVYDLVSKNFGGGPKIQLFTIKKEKLKGNFENIIDNTKEPYIDSGIAIPLQTIKLIIQYEKNQEVIQK